MHLKRRIDELLNENLNETQLLRALQQLITEYDCDHDFYSEPALDIPPPGFVRIEPELNLIYG